jgi:hypothetical protein
MNYLNLFYYFQSTPVIRESLLGKITPLVKEKDNNLFVNAAEIGLETPVKRKVNKLYTIDN